MCHPAALSIKASPVKTGFSYCPDVQFLKELPAMQIVYELTEKDFTEAYSAHRNRKPLTKWLRRIFIWSFVLFAAVVLFGFLVKPSAQMARNLMPFFGLVVMWILVIWFLPRWLMRRQFLKQPGAHGQRTVTLGADGVHWRWNGG